MVPNGTTRGWLHPSAIQLVKNLEYYKWTNHIDTKYYFIHEKWETKQIKLSYVHTSDHIVNLLTKLLPKYSNQRLWSYMGMITPNFHLLTWVNERNLLYAHKTNDIYNVWVGVLNTQQSSFIYESLCRPWKK